jgi:hypothetical protein
VPGHHLPFSQILSGTTPIRICLNSREFSEAPAFPSTVDVDDSVVGRSRWCESALTSSSPSNQSRLVGEPTCFYSRCSPCKLLKLNIKAPVCKSHFGCSRKCFIFNLLRFKELRPTLLKRVQMNCFKGISQLQNRLQQMARRL